MNQRYDNRMTHRGQDLSDRSRHTRREGMWNGLGTLDRGLSGRQSPTTGGTCPFCLGGREGGATTLPASDRQARQNTCGCGGGSNVSRRTDMRNGTAYGRTRSDGQNGGCGCGRTRSDDQSNGCGCGRTRNDDQNQNGDCGCGCGQDTGDCHKLLRQIQTVDFALYEVILYLDAYPEDCEALATYHKLLTRRNTLVAAYEETCGPITAFGNVSTTSWDWVKTASPWEYPDD